jgi:ABC-type nickel/cobalt efflux system permease component RcnA
MVDARQLAGPVSWRKMLAVVFSVGIRPCTGAILVLVFALTQGLFWAGVAATFAMALGTAITVAALATLAIGSLELALRLGGTNSNWTTMVWSICAIGGATVILLFGVLMFGLDVDIWLTPSWRFRAASSRQCRHSAGTGAKGSRQQRDWSSAAQA